MKPLSRREALKAAAAAAATGCAGRDVGGGKDQDDTGTLPPGQIDHVIVVMMENRSFDHWLGGRALFEGMSAEDGPTEAMFNLNTLGDPVAPHTSTAPCVADPPHGWDSSHRQFNDGANDGFCTEYAAQAGGTGDGVMAVMERSTIPLTYALADRFCVMDRHFCSVLGPTWPNRLYAHMASSQGVRGNYLPGPAEPFSDRTIWHALNEMGIDWHYYYGDVPFIGLFEGL